MQPKWLQVFDFLLGCINIQLHASLQGHDVLGPKIPRLVTLVDVSKFLFPKGIHCLSAPICFSLQRVWLGILKIIVAKTQDAPVTCTRLHPISQLIPITWTSNPQLISPIIKKKKEYVSGELGEQEVGTIVTCNLYLWVTSDYLPLRIP